VLISGAGIAGPTLAYWLLQHGFVPTLVERAPAPRTGGYMIDFWGVGYDVVDRMGLVPALQRVEYRIDGFRLVDRNGRRVASIDGRAFAAASGGRYTSLLRSDLARCILEALDGRAETIFGDGVRALEDDGSGIVATLERGGSRRFDLVVGADGLHSRVRALTWGRDAHAERYLGYYAASFAADGYPHRDEGAYVSYGTPGRQAARYALRGGRSAFLLVVARDEPLPPGHRERAMQEAMLREVFGGAGWECDEILARMSDAPDLYFDVVSQIRLASWSRGRVVLLGDAAACPSLLSGQGSALAMAGAYELAHALAAADGDHRAAFARYERRFKPFVEAKQQAAANFAAWFAPRTPLRLWIRDTLTRLMRFPSVTRTLLAPSVRDRFALPD
jgi:2-polyprenyl-6-methoxyphenol hydroxylase-like FAD-dependent oxidoreductase